MIKTMMYSATTRLELERTGVLCYRYVEIGQCRNQASKVRYQCVEMERKKTKTKRKVYSLRWRRHEVKTLLRVLREYGDKNIKKIAQFIPTRTKSQIVNYLQKHRESALKKFTKKNRLQIQDSFNDIHPWMSFINVHCTSSIKTHDPIVAHILPIWEKYANHPSAKLGNVNFEVAYRALFNALVTQKFPEDLNLETFSMIYASLNSLHEEIRTHTSKDEKIKDIFRECLSRRFTDTSRIHKRNKEEENDTLMLPQVNVLQLTRTELHEVCEI